MFTSGNAPPINAKNSSFGRPAGSQYKPSGPNYYNPSQNQGTKRKNRTVGGDWGNDNNSNEIVQPAAQDKPKSGFKFLNKEKEEKSAKEIENLQKEMNALISPEELESDQYNYHKQCIIEVIQPAGV